ncbi:MAG: transcription termination/antitermination protein NusG [Firmicutes bacterium]|nr:transcription termination/antitermination protein NusG [Bacillota bacterium]
MDEKDLEQVSEQVVEAEQAPETVEVKEKSVSPYRDSPDSKWYVLHTFSGYENVAKENLETVVEKFNLQDRIFDIVIPMEDVIEEKNGKKKLVSRKVMPCYLLVKMIYGDDMWHNITRTRGITGFVGPKGRPLALTEEEIRKMRLEVIRTDVNIQIGDKVEVIDGPLMNMLGIVLTVDEVNSRAKVNVEMFGRETPVDLDFSQLRVIKD